MEGPAECEFSVVIPAYGAAPYLARSLDSVARQTYLPLEVIIVDDASPIPITLPKAAAEWPFSVKLLRLRVNGGGGVARNAGVEVCSTEYVVFLDCDDMMDERYLKQLGRAWRTSAKDVGAITVGFFWCDENMRPYRRQSIAPGQRVDRNSLLKAGNFVGGVSVISVRRKAFMASGGFPALRACQDWGLLLAIAEKHRIKSIPDPFVFYMSPTFNAGSITRSSRRAILSVCAIYRIFDPTRGKQYQIKSDLVAYYLMRSGRHALGLKLIGYSYKKFGRISSLLLKAIYEGYVPRGIQVAILRLRSLRSRL